MRHLICLVILCAVPALADSYIPGVYNLQVQQGEDFARTLIFTDSARNPVNLTGYTFSSVARTQPTSGAILANISTATNSSAGTVRIRISRATTAAIGGKVGYWDLKIIDPESSVGYLLKGQFYVAPTETR